jgi:hypothetical protein
MRLCQNIFGQKKENGKERKDNKTLESQNVPPDIRIEPLSKTGVYQWLDAMTVCQYYTLSYGKISQNLTFVKFFHKHGRLIINEGPDSVGPAWSVRCENHPAPSTSTLAESACFLYTEFILDPHRSTGASLACR